jgi:PAS domain-containing protein
MTPMTADALLPDTAGAAADPSQRLHKVVLRLVKGGPERRAIAAGEADAILDPASGSAFLLPGAQRWLLERGMRQQADVPAPDAQAPTGIDGVAAEIGVLDASGIVLSGNWAWRNAAPDCLGAGLRPGANYLVACDTAAGTDRVDGLALAAGIRQVIAGERKIFRYEHACTLARGRCWFAFSVTPAAEGSRARAIVLRDDITERRHDERLLELEYAVARALAEAATAGAALQAVMKAMCESQGWDCGRYFRLDPTDGALRFEECWGLPTPAVEQFLARSRDVAFRPGAGLAGRVYRSGQPLWIIAGVRGHRMAPAALAPETEDDGAFIFPVTGENRTLGVLAFSGRGIREPNDRMLQAVRAIGSQLGRCLRQQQSLEALRRSEARFRRLTVLSTDWYWEQDRDGRFTESVGDGAPAGDHVLGKRLWELPAVGAGSADWADHQAQIGERWSFCDFEFTATGQDGQPGYYSISGEPVFDASGAFTGYWGTGMDITRRKLAEIALRADSAR